MPKGRNKDTRKNNGANLGFEEKLWQAALLGSVTFGVIHKDTKIPVLVVRK
jgi:hypothetical protein